MNAPLTIAVDDVRRLTGPNVLSREPLVVVDFKLPSTFAESDRATLLADYLRELGRMRDALGIEGTIAPVVRPFKEGVTVGYTAPVDVLLTCAEISEWAANTAASFWTNDLLVPLETARAPFAEMLAAARNSRLIALADEAKRRDLSFLWDDEDVSIGYGRASILYAYAAIPEVQNVPWASLQNVPLALVTGTNGKTTSTRLLAHVARAALKESGRVVGVSSSDGIRVGDAIVATGDWTGPAAARRVLRHPDVDLAVLETARGGILRRGLAMNAADVALLTNISADHLGGFGIDDVDAMADVKAVVARSVRPGGTVVLNARDVHLVKLAETLPAKITFFADLEAGHAGNESHGKAAAVIAAHRATGGAVVFSRDGAIYAAHGVDAAKERFIAKVTDVPITFDGAARYNVENALGVVGAAHGLGFDDDAIARGLRSFGSEDNPRRGQLVERRGVKVFLDFGHNPAAVRAAMGVVSGLRKGNRLTVITASPGDRSDDDMADVARAVLAASPDRVLVRELPHYLRGRAPGEVSGILQRAFHALGLRDDAFAFADTEVDALRSVFADANAGDVIAVLVHLDTAEVGAFLDSLAP